MASPVGYCLLPFEPMSWHRPGDDFEAIAAGLEAIKAAGFGFAESTAKMSSTLDLARRNMADRGFPVAPFVRTDIDAFHRVNRIIELAEERGVRLTSLFSGGELINPHTTEAELDHLVLLARVFSASGIPHITISGGPYRPEHFDEDVDSLARALSEVGRRISRFGVQLNYHPHVRTCVETPEEIDRFVSESDPDYVFLLFDTAHIAAAGGDPVEVARRHRDRIGYVHLKDIMSPSAGVDLRIDGAYRQAFRNVGEGNLDFEAILGALDVHRFDGPVMAELDVSADPISDVRRVASFLFDELSLARES